MEDLWCYEISKYLDVRCYSTLMLTSKYMYKLCNKFKPRYGFNIDDVRDRLKKKGINVSELDNFLKSTNSFISGSFPLQVVLREEWDDSDIDIYVSNEHVYHDHNFDTNVQDYPWLLKYFPESSVEIEQCRSDTTCTKYTSEHQLTFLDNYYAEHGGHCKDYHYLRHPYINYVINTKLNGNSAQFIVYKSGFDIIPTFDLDICKTLYDGVNLKFNWDMVVNKSFSLNMNDLYNRLKPIYKLDNTGPEDLFNILKLKERTEKYRRRGFEIAIKN
jgi:hypothetical protein